MAVLTVMIVMAVTLVMAVMAVMTVVAVMTVITTMVRWYDGRDCGGTHRLRRRVANKPWLWHGGVLM